MTEPINRLDELVTQISALASHSALTVGVAESLTGGQISSALANGKDAAQWFRGSLVAYAPEVKFDVLGVEPGPVNTKECAAQMASGASKLLNCDVAVSATGVGGPGADEGVPPGTVFIACARSDHDVALGEHHIEGSPEQVVTKAVELALQSILTALLEID